MQQNYSKMPKKTSKSIKNTFLQQTKLIKMRQKFTKIQTKLTQTFYNPYILQTLSPIFVSVSPVSSNSHTLFPTSLFFFLSSLLFSTSPTQNQPPTHSKHRKNTTKAPKNSQSRFFYIDPLV
jgi:hypothetical protein